MYSYLRGSFKGCSEGVVVLDVGGVGYEILVPPIVEHELSTQAAHDEELVLFVSAQSTRDQPWPTLFGFLRTEERAFWELLRSVPRVGGKGAAKAMALPIALIAQAVHDANKVFLDGLPGVTLDGADKMIAALRKKVAPFLVPVERPRPSTPVRAGDEEVRDDAVALLVVMGVKRPDAQRAVDQLLGSREDILSVQDVITEYFRVNRVAR